MIINNIFIYARSFADIIQEYPAVFTLILGYAVYKLSKKTYDDNNAPAIIPIRFNIKEQKITIVNKGKGIAQNIKVEAFRCFVTFPIHKPRLWRLSFKTIGFLPPGEERIVEIEEGDEVLFAYYFSEYSKQKTPLSIVYKNLSGKRYKTTIVIKHGAFNFIRFGTYPIEVGILRDIYEYLNYWRVKFIVNLEHYIKRQKK